jgi:hypothetical protein
MGSLSPAQISDLIVQHVMNDPDGNVEITRHLLDARHHVVADGDPAVAPVYRSGQDAERFFLEVVAAEFQAQGAGSSEDGRGPWWPEAMPLNAAWPGSLLKRIGRAMAKQAVAEIHDLRAAYIVESMARGLVALCGSDPWTI